VLDCEAVAGQALAYHVSAALAVSDNTSTMNHCVCLLLLMHFSVNHSVLYNLAWVRYTIEQCGCLVQLYFKHESARKFQHVSRRTSSKWQSIHYLVSKLKTTGSLLDKKPDRKWNVLTVEVLDNIGARLEETSPRKSLKWLAQETGVSRTSARKATKLLELQPYKTMIVHALKEHDPVARINFGN
jgi:hypothetical protein